MMQVWKLLIVLYTNEEGMGIIENMALELCLELSLAIFFGNETISVTSGWGSWNYEGNRRDVFEADWTGNWSHVDEKAVVDSIGKGELPH